MRNIYQRGYSIRN